MAGLINSVTKPKIAAMKPLTVDVEDPLNSLAGYDPAQRVIDPATQTVQGQIQGIIAADSPLMQQARTSAAQQSNQRGLLNSSMGVQAGEQAVLGAALPIASADASIYNTVDDQNMAAQNAASQFSSGAQNTGALQTLQGNQQLQAIEKQGEQATGLQTLQGQQQLQAIQKQAEAEAGIQTLKGGQATALQTLQGAQQLELQGLRGDQAQAVAQIEGQHRQLMQTSASAANQFSQISASIGAILANPDMTPENKQSQINKQIEVLQASMAVIGSIGNVNLTDLLVWG